MHILKMVKKVPGGLMIVPLLLGAAFNTWLPGLITLGGSGTFTSYLWKSGAMPILAVFLFCNGAQINVKRAGIPLAKGVVLTVVKVGLGIILGVLVNKIWGPNGILGIAPLAIVGAISNSNGGLYAALAGEFGDETDVGAVSILSINDGPFFTMVALGATGMADIPFMTLVGCVLPIVVGCILGNIDEDIREFCAPGATIMIPFFAFPLGAGLTFTNLISAGLPGILLGVVCTAVTGLIGYLVYKIGRVKRPQVGAAIGTTAGNAAATPEALANADPTLAIVAASATVQISAAIIVTAILCPLLVTFLDRVERKKHPERYVDDNREKAAIDGEMV
ncbi:2-keto-3-deoxygluconate permease [Pseudoflavonifractor intestinihominis]|uniref:2-keto-3-deoxygluconate permease n=1 Tax=Pseudoflavonifractor intestinihominis TaxID=3133171 RepID=A0ABV1E5D0_9FIRM|nr:2-keto-3-deoxygluconate permease [uncultured Pseudoflavonifractor sp.]